MAGNNDVHRGPAKIKRIKAALNRYADAHPDALDKFAAQLWNTALIGDVPAMRELADRLDGKVPQAVVGDTDHPPVQLERIERVVIDSENPNSESLPPAA